jgi:arsenate reductase
MAEALINHRLGDTWQAFSAGTIPAGYVHPKALQVLGELGIVHQGESKHADRFREMDLDLAITVCDDAAENCPVWLGSGRRVHIRFPDPAKANGSEQEVLGVFREVRDDIDRKVVGFLKNLPVSPSGR